MELLIGKRYSTLNELKEDIEKITNKIIGSIIISDSDIICDNMIDYYFINDEFDIKTLWFLYDNNGCFYITEV